MILFLCRENGDFGGLLFTISGATANSISATHICSRQLFPVPVKENLPDSIQITPAGMLKVVRQMNPDQRREFTRLLFA